jgi:hypothetical protein
MASCSWLYDWWATAQRVIVTETFVLLLCVFLVLPACAKHGVFIQTEDEFNSDLELGWGPSSVLSGKIIGGMTMCIPSKTAMKSNDEAKWCAEMRKATLGEP